MSEDDACVDALRLPRGADTLAALFAARARVAPHHTFLLQGGRQWSWREVDEAAAQCADRLVGAGCRPSDRVAAVLPNGCELVVLLLACARARLVFCPIDPASTAAERDSMLATLKPAAVIAAGDADRDGARDAEPDRGPGGRTAGDRGDLVASADDPLTILFTSGTTGAPKGAIHTQRTYVTAAEVAAWRMRLSPADTCLVVLPLFHLNALFYSVGGAIAAGARLVIEERFSASSFWRTVARHRVTQVNLIAAVGNILLKRDRSEFPGNDSLRKVSAAPVSADLAERLAREFRVSHVVESYGMTEAPCIAQGEFGDRGHRECLGRPIRHPLTGDPISEVRIVDGAGRPLAAGETGRIQVRSRTMMTGYFGRPDLAAAIDPQGWFLTEDFGELDAHGWCWFRGRTAEMIRCRGENVAASRVESVLLTHPAITDAACVGTPSELGDEDVVAVVCTRAGAALGAAELSRFCEDRLAPHQRPRWLVVRSDLPRTATQKIARHRLRAEPDLLRGAQRC